MRAFWRGACALALAAMTIGTAQAAPPVPSAWDQDRVLGRGVNIIGYDPLWKDFRQGRFKTYHFSKIRQAGFSTVRIVPREHPLRLLFVGADKLPAARWRTVGRLFYGFT